MRRDAMVTALCLLLGMAIPTRAEVRALTDRNGDYKTTRVVLDSRSGRVWGSLRRGDPASVLNAAGDRNGDLYPAIRESTVAPHHPWVVWSRVNGDRYDLAWSRWEQGGWDPVRWVSPEGEDRGDSLDSYLTFDASGRAYVVWWRAEPGGGRVYLSMFLATSWMTAYAVSEPGVDSRYPTIEVPQPGLMIVRYDTAAGTIEHEVLFDEPVTITDDINPLDYMHDGAVSVISD